MRKTERMIPGRKERRQWCHLPNGFHLERCLLRSFVMHFWVPGLDRSCLPLKYGLFWPNTFHYRNYFLFLTVVPQQALSSIHFSCGKECARAHAHAQAQRHQEQGKECMAFDHHNTNCRILNQNHCARQKKVCSFPFGSSTDPDSNLSLTPPVVYGVYAWA